MQKLGVIYITGGELFTSTLKEAAVQFLNKYRKSCPVLKKESPGSSVIIQELLGKLPPKERLVLLLHDSYQMSYPEIGQVIENDDARSICYRGRIQLCHQLKNNGILM